MRVAALTLLLYTFSVPAWAIGARVEAVQLPAWYERAGVRQALKPGIELNSGDILSTGPSARILVLLDEGSVLKLGQNARLDLTGLIPPYDETGYFEVALHVIKGAFRYTTGLLEQPYKRRVDVRIGSISAGIRGTDIWGNSHEDKDILCLIEGRVRVQREGEPVFDMQKQLSYFQTSRNKPASAIRTVPEAQLKQWANETELQAGTSMLRSNGGWAVNLMSLNNKEAAESVLMKLVEAGFPAEVQAFNVQNQERYRVRISGFASREDAQGFAGFVDGQFGINRPWIEQLLNTVIPSETK